MSRSIGWRRRIGSSTPDIGVHLDSVPDPQPQRGDEVRQAARGVDAHRLKICRPVSLRREGRFNVRLGVT